ncbi:MAG: hypothetical protein U0Y68_17220 [Blastocatellia bacterium]
MKNYPKKTYLIVSVALLTLLLTAFLALRTPAVQAVVLSGSINTTNIDGSIPNENKYDLKTDVYIKQSNGGPGLPDGTYYFQVTNPSGSVLLSTDNAECRQLVVTNGKIAGVLPGPCSHQNGTPNDGTTPVQLAPFATTPNNGNEYKVWLIAQTLSTSVDPNNPKVIIFNQNDSNTDNFKVKQPIDPPCEMSLKGTKFFDANANGQLDTGEVGLGGVQISISIDGGLPVTVLTASDGSWSYPITVGSSYKVCEIVPSACATDVAGTYWVQTAPAANSLNERCYSGIASSCADITGLNFGNLSFAPASGGLTLGFWSNKNGQAQMSKDTGVYQYLSTQLCLKDYSGADFDPANYNQFRTWLLNGNAVNMAYMLSVQLAATSLDVRYNFLRDNTIVDARSLGTRIAHDWFFSRCCKHRPLRYGRKSHFHRQSIATGRRTD